MTKEDYFTILHETKGSSEIVKGLPFVEMKNLVLGKKYSLSLVFVSPSKSKKLNNEYRGKSRSTDILSFPVSKNEGEIFIDISTSKKEAKKFDRDLKNFVGFLFIHGLVHLKGFRHGSTMEKQEVKFRKKFEI